MQSGNYSQQLISSTKNSNANYSSLEMPNSFHESKESQKTASCITSSTSMLSELLRKQPALASSKSANENISLNPGALHQKHSLHAPTTDATIHSAGSSLGMTSIEEISTSPGTIVRSPDELVCSNSYHIDDYILESQSIGLVFENTAKLLPQREVDITSPDIRFRDYTGKPFNVESSDYKPLSYMSYFDDSTHRNYESSMNISTDSLNNVLSKEGKDEKNNYLKSNIDQTLSSDKTCLKMAADSTDYTHQQQSDPKYTNYQNQFTKELSLEPKYLESIFGKSLKPSNQLRSHHSQIPISLSQSPWCSIFYYELNARIGDVFHSDSAIIIVDGFTEPCYRSDRFSLGGLSNVNRSLQVLSTRPHIGKGIKLIKTETEVFIHCLSKSAIFVQSLSCNRYHNWHLATVVKVPSGCKLKIFDKKEFIKLMLQFEQENFEAVYSLTHFCLVRLSFVKGWGDDYKRQTVTSTPCWIEIHLNEPLKWLDPVLSRLGSPKKPCTSTS